MSERNEAARLAHSAYFAGETDGGCVGCHRHVGHANLKAELADYYDYVELPAAADEAAEQTSASGADG